MADRSKIPSSLRAGAVLLLLLAGSFLVGSPTEAALIIRPQRPLRFGGHYAVVLREGLRDAGGQPLATAEPFRLVRDELEISSDALRSEAERLRPMLERLSELGVKLSRVLLAWDFHTAS